MVRWTLALLLLLGTAATARAELVRLEIKSRQPYLEGKAHGDRGAYEQWTGVAHFAVDPSDPANKNIVDLDKSPRNQAGRVEFQADIEMFVPADRSKATGAAFYEVNNRGNKTAINMFNGGADEFLCRQGLVCIWSGWIAETLPGGGRLRLNAPVPSENGKPVRGQVRAEFVVDKPGARASIAHRANQGSYRPAADAEDKATLTMRLNEADARKEVPRDQWKFVVSDAGGQLPLVEIEAAGGLKPGFIYEVIYEAEGSVVQGAGMAGIRDLISFLKYDTSDRNPLLAADGKPLVTRAHSFGTSQSGRLLRHFVYEGFNADERGRQVFDGVISHVAGAGLGSFNERFSSPTRTNGQHEEHLYGADRFPFTYGGAKNPYTDEADGILKKAVASKTAPKLMHTQSSSEYWHRSGSLVHTDPLGKQDAPLPANVRVYAFGGTQHGPGGGIVAPKAGGQLPSNPNDYRPLLRALLVAMDAWVTKDQDPPASSYPKIEDGTLVEWPVTKSGWNTVSHVSYPQVIQQPGLYESGPYPRVTDRLYGVRVPGYGPDNNERGTLNLPTISVPVATYTSWNLRDASIGAPGELLGLQGGYIPFAKTKRQRDDAGDPRPALLERYKNFADYQQQFMAAAQKLADERYLLAEDLPRLKSLSEKHRELFGE